MSTRTHLRALAVLAPLLMLAAALPLPAAGQAPQPIQVSYERPDDSRVSISANPAGWTETFPVGYPIGRDQSDGSLDLIVKNLGSATIDTLSFRVGRDRGQDIGADETDDDSYIEFLQGTSGATGWQPTVFETNVDNQITFTHAQGSSSLLTPGAEWRFTIGYAVHGPLESTGGDPYQFTVTAQGEYTTGGLATPFTFRFTLDEKDPDVVDPANARSVLTRDLNSNGHIDQVLVTYDDLLDVSSFALEHYRINGQTPVQADFGWIPAGGDLVGGEPQHGECPAVDEAWWGCTQIRFTIEEGTSYDTGTTPFVTHNPSGASLTDPANNAVPAGSRTAADGAAPILVGALARTSDSSTSTLETVLLTFSEGVGASSQLAATDFSYTDTTFSAGHQQADPSNSGTPLDYPWVQAVEHSPGSEFVVLVFRDAKGDGFAPALTVGDAPSVAPEKALADGSADTVGCRLVGGVVRIRDTTTNGPNGEGIACRTTGALAVPVLSVAIIEAATDISSKEVRLRFNAPVESSSGRSITAALGAFDIRGTQSGGVIAITDVVHQRCTDTVVLTVANTVLPTDVDDTPAEIVIESGKVKGCSYSVPGGASANPPTLAPAPVPLRDTTQPKIIALRTVDMDHNGAIDGFEATFSEPVRDLSFCAGSNPCPVGSFLSLHVRDAAEASFYDLADYGPFTFETRSVSQVKSGNTAVGKDDNMGIIRWPQNDPDLANALLTGYVPDLDVQVGLFEDLAPTNLPGGSNLMKRLTRSEVEETDAAAPVLRMAITLDTDTYSLNATGVPIPGCIYNHATSSSVGACQRGPNGFLDGYMLVFTEPVRDSSYSPQEWTVDGYQLETARPLRPMRDSRDSINDDLLFLPFFEKNLTADNEPIHGDTGVIPQLTYRYLSANRGLQDLRGNSLDPVTDAQLLDLGPDDIDEFDGAAPVIVAAEGFIGQTWVRVHFSESVDDGQDGALVRSDFVWKNMHLGGAGGITNSPQVEHRTGDRVATIHLNAALQLGDIMHDQVSAYFDQANGIGAIYETQTKVIERQFVSGAARALQNATDRTPPGNVSELNHTFLGPDRIVLAWRAPSEDGNGTGPDAPPVSHYSIKVSPDHISSFPGGTNAKEPPNGDILHSSVHSLPTGVQIKAYEPAKLVKPGSVQKVEIVGLQPDVRYNFAVIGVDEAGLVSPEPAVITRTTNVDITPPVGTMAPSVTNTQSGRVVTLDVDVQWTALSDEETNPLEYRFLLSKDPLAEVTRDEKNRTEQTQVSVTAPTRGTWYFHVRGFSGVPGQQETLPVTISAPSIDAGEAEDYVFFFNDPSSPDHSVKVERKDGANIVRWTLPEGPPGTIEAIQVWRLDGLEWTVAATLPGDFESLRTGSYTDRNGSKDSRYFVTPVYEGNQGVVDPGDIGLLDDQATRVSDTGGLKWYWIAASVMAFLLVLGAVVMVVIMRGRQDAATLPLEPEQAEGWSDVSEEGVLPTHDVDCPNCNHAFQAVGHLPLPIQCPECGVSGKLE